VTMGSRSAAERIWMSMRIVGSWAYGRRSRVVRGANFVAARGQLSRTGDCRPSSGERVPAEVVWLVTLPCVLLALLLIGSPQSPALERALDSAFAPVDPAEAAPTSGVEPVGNDFSVPPPVSTASGPTRLQSDGPGVVLPMYVSFAILQALDIHSTMTALNRGGAHESNPLMADVVDKPVAFVTLKAATGAGIIYLTERVRKRSRTGAIVMMAAFNSIYATIVAHNYRLATR
jgi:hypothetical protein